MLDFQVSTIVFTVINLLVLYFILRKLLFGRVNAVLEQRAARAAAKVAQRPTEDGDRALVDSFLAEVGEQA